MTQNRKKDTQTQIAEKTNSNAIRLLKYIFDIQFCFMIIFKYKIYNYIESKTFKYFHKL